MTSKAMSYLANGGIRYAPSVIFAANLIKSCAILTPTLGASSLARIIHKKRQCIN